MAAFTSSLKLPAAAGSLQRTPSLNWECTPLISLVRSRKRGGQSPQLRILASADVTADPNRPSFMVAAKKQDGGRAAACVHADDLQEDHLKLLTTHSSPYGMRVMVALHEKGLKFEFEQEVLHSFSSTLMMANPVHKRVPVLIHNGKALAESRIIMEYLDEQWPASPSSPRGNLLPASPLARAQARFWSEFIDSKFLFIAHDMVIANGEKQRSAIEKTIQLLHRIDRDALKLHTPESLASFNKRGPFFNNENTIGFFDITFVGILQWLRAVEFLSPFKIPNAQQCPRLNAWIDAVSEVPSVQKCTPSIELLIKRGQASRCRRDFDDWNTLYKKPPTGIHSKDQIVSIA